MYHNLTAEMISKSFITYSPRIMNKLSKPYKKRRFGQYLSFIIGIILGFFIGMDLKICPENSFIRKVYISNNGTDDLNEKMESQKDSPVNLMLIGILTANEFMNTRVMAINETWAKTIHGKVLFFSGENSTIKSNRNQSLITLLGVNDAYPPQKKSFLVLKYMHDLYLDQFEWFVRADDDVYIVGDKLAKFLVSVNSSKVYYIGHSGQGRKHEKGKLGLFDNKTYCMGGPGVIISRTTLAKVAPHISYCLQNLYSNHEDTEIGRCINQFADVSCTLAYEVCFIT